MSDKPRAGISCFSITAAVCALALTAVITATILSQQRPGTASSSCRLLALDRAMRHAANASGNATAAAPAPAHQETLDIKEDRINQLVTGQEVLKGCTASQYLPTAWTKGSQSTGMPSRLQSNNPSAMPSQFKNYDLNNIAKQELMPKTLSSLYPGQQGNEPHVRFHWVFTSCSRQNWGRTLSSTLLSGLTSDLYPATINILWCRPYDQNDLPPLLYNMRHSHQVNIFFFSPQLQAANASHVVKILVSALLIPCALGMPQLPILYTEDDVMFAPDANARLHNALAGMPEQGLREPFVLALYDPGDIKPTPDAESGIQQPLDDFGNAAHAHSSKTWIEVKYWFGIQGAYFSPSLVSLLLSEYIQMMEGKLPTPDAWQDLIVFDIIKSKWHCSIAGSGCRYYMMHPSLVQHIGTTSAVFQQNSRNQRFHYARDFPARLRFPGFENHTQW